MDAGICLQTITKEDGAAGIAHYPTEVFTDSDKSIGTLLGASPGASVFASIMPEVLTNCLPGLFQERKTQHEPEVD